MVSEILRLKSSSMIATDGYLVLRDVFEEQECQRWATEVGLALARCGDEATALRKANGAIYGARNLLNVFPAATSLWRKPRLSELLRELLGDQFGLVRGLFFDKPPDSNWSLPWHQDLTIAVQDNALPSERFRNPTLKAGVPHVEAPDDLLGQMLTLRIHLDEVTEENGPLHVLPGSHVGRGIEHPYRPPVTIYASAGDVLAMRPLLSHSSSAAKSGTLRHRRVIHLEFAGCRELPDGFRWHKFVPA
jgi:hypothetical protein